MGTAQSQPRTVSPDPYVSLEERAKAQEEMRAKQQAALDKRLLNQTKKQSSVPNTNRPQSNTRPKKLSALEQMSKENIGWRHADSNREIRDWN